MLVTIQTEHETLTYSGVTGYTLEFDNGIMRLTQPKGQAYDGPSETDRADAWETRCGELEQELRDAQERIHEQDWVIAKYDDDNRELKDAMDSTDTEISMFREELVKAEAEREQYKADVEELKKRNDRLWLQNRNMATWQSRSEAVEGHKWDSEMLEDYGNCTPPKVSLNEWAKCIHENAVRHGWWETEDGKCDDGDRPFPEIVALCHSELSEALEEYRNGRLLYYPGENGKPEGIATEMIDCIIRILDWAAHEQVRVDDVMEAKVKYNEGRPYRHGGKKA